MLKYSVSNWIYGKEDLKTTFKRLKRFNYNGVELTGEPNRYSIKDVRKLCKNYDLDVLSIAGIYPWPTKERDLSNPASQVRKRAVKYLNRCCNFAKELNAPLVIVVPSAVGKTQPVNKPKTEAEWKKALKDEWNYAVDSVNKASEYAEGLNIKLAIEPINRYETFLVNTVQQALEFVSQIDSPAVKIHLDTFHMNIEEKSLSQAISNVGDLLYNIHVADSNREAVGRGHIDFRSMIRTLYKIGYKRSLALEPLPPVPNPYLATEFTKFKDFYDVYARESIKKLKQYEVEVKQEIEQIKTKREGDP